MNIPTWFGVPDPEDYADIEAEMKQDNEILEAWLEVNWRISGHNHQDLQHHNTCPLCIMEWALYGGRR